jgi:hypothetical protein
MFFSDENSSGKLRITNMRFRERAFFCVPVLDCFGVQIYQEISGLICFVQERVIFHIPDMFFFQNSNLNRYSFFSYFFAFYSRYVFSSMYFAMGFVFRNAQGNALGSSAFKICFFFQERVDLTFMICFFVTSFFQAYTRFLSV